MTQEADHMKQPRHGERVGNPRLVEKVMREQGIEKWEVLHRRSLLEGTPVMMPTVKRIARALKHGRLLNLREAVWGNIAKTLGREIEDFCEPDDRGYGDLLAGLEGWTQLSLYKQLQTSKRIVYVGVDPLRIPLQVVFPVMTALQILRHSHWKPGLRGAYEERHGALREQLEKKGQEVVWITPITIVLEHINRIAEDPGHKDMLVAELAKWWGTPKNGLQVFLIDTEGLPDKGRQLNLLAEDGCAFQLMGEKHLMKQKHVTHRLRIYEGDRHEEVAELADRLMKEGSHRLNTGRGDAGKVVREFWESRREARPARLAR
jgi:hypothetical protein